MTTFVDTNVLAYARDTSEPDKQPLAARWMEHLWRTGTGRTSMQVLDEYDITVTRNLSPGLDKQWPATTSEISAPHLLRRKRFAAAVDCRNQIHL